MRSKLRAVLFLLSLCASALSAEKSRTYTVIGYGSESCGQVVAYIKEGDTYADRALVAGWLAGYLTAINERFAPESDITARTDMEGILLWTQNYCSANPSNQLHDAATALVKELMGQSKL